MQPETLTPVKIQTIPLERIYKHLPSGKMEEPNGNMIDTIDLLQVEYSPMAMRTVAVDIFNSFVPLVDKEVIAKHLFSLRFVYSADRKEFNLIIKMFDHPGRKGKARGKSSIVELESTLLSSDLTSGPNLLRLNTLCGRNETTLSKLLTATTKEFTITITDKSITISHLKRLGTDINTRFVDVVNLVAPLPKKGK